MTKNFLQKKSLRHILLIGIATGLYPLLFYYSNNFSLINSWKHVAFFLALFISFPIILMVMLHFLAPKIRFVKAHYQGLLTFSNLFLFSLFILICLYASIPFYFLIISIVIGVVGGYFFKNHLFKIVVFQLLLAFVGLFYFVPRVHQQLTYSEDWKILTDNIERVTFTKAPNIYYIQTDGYVNFSEIGKGYYQYDNGNIKRYLENKGFNIQYNIRSNYTATLESNMAIFALKHHYYNFGYNFSEMTNARETIVTDNVVLRVLKNNGYKTHFLAEWPYLISNLPKMGYDYCNFEYSSISLISEGFGEKKEIFKSLQEVFDSTATKPNFYFMEILDPGHVTSRKSESLGKVKEKEQYFEKLERCNTKLVKIIDFLTIKDPEALIVILADHGGYVGYEYMLENRHKTDDRDLWYSAFSSQLAIKWPDGKQPEEAAYFKTSINLFRILFSYLSNNSQYLQNLQEDASFTIIEKGAPKGIYKVIDSTGAIVFKKV
ncbi:MAG: sulfatase-like hydrolase/transferase [Flavobacteriaceae bacterium]